MTQPMTLREKVARMVSLKCWEFYDRHAADPRMKAEINHEVAPSLQLTDAILTALASGSGDHAELARLAEIAAAVESGAGNGISFREEGAVTLAADIRALIAENAALRSERDRAEGRIRDLAAMFGVCDGGRYLNDWKAHCDRATEAERKLAEARGLLEKMLAAFCGPLTRRALGGHDERQMKVTLQTLSLIHI